jgi:hypothetical protein
VSGRLWTKWKRIAHRAAEIQSQIVLTALYWIIVVPIGLVRFKRRPTNQQPGWIERAPADKVTLEDARRQF